MKWVAILAMAALAACATRPAAPDLTAQRQAVEAVLARVAPEHAAVLAAADAGDEAELARRVERHRAARAQVLEPLAGAGNAEAMFRLAWDLRDEEAPGAIVRWQRLVTRAAAGGHPDAHDELVRWWWHQKGDGSLAAVQRYRARALDHAAPAAAGGQWHAINRIGVYIAGNVHQYPANLPLAAKVLRLCARGGHRECQERLAGAGSYDLGADPAERAFWRDVAAGLAVDWRPEPWAAMAGEWRELRAEILAHGAGSVGTYGPCSTSTPWCRGSAVDLD
ncbi:hypothetical protein [Phenylobacterium sp.]|jgi:hypothetical protein|uniref:hypothetical protein n=1 Tax=Phenylobacterium sp. TaxID=1871053 RepID=UPI002F926ADF